MRLKLAAPLLMLAASAGAGPALGNFAAADGFAGQHGVTCVACHNLPHPTQDDARAVLTGLPEAWDPGVAYPLTIAVEGGPTPLPAPQPQGGFEIATRNATLRMPPESTHLLRQPDPASITYRPEGTLMRAWSVEWVAPTLASYPANATVWLAVVAANGNHAIATNASDGGERFDSVDSLVTKIPPSPGAFAAWRALPLAAPTYAVAEDTDGWLVTGRQQDPLADAIAWRVDSGAWQRRPAATLWQVELPSLGAGGHTVEVQSQGQERVSPIVPATFGARESPLGRAAPAAPLPLALLSLPATLALLRSRRP